MKRQSMIMGLLAETSLHPGGGQTTGAVDLPVAREVATDYPVIVGSSLKGALRDQAQVRWPGDGHKPHEIVRDVFGEQDSAGGLAVSDARLLLLPVRSLTGHFKWATCPYLLERYQRDRQLAAWPAGFDVLGPERDSAIVGDGTGSLFLEELSFTTEVRALGAVAEAIQPLMKHSTVRERLEKQLVILHDDDFAYFARYGLQVNARNVLDNKKTSDGLWYEETLPPDSLFYSLLIARPGKEEGLGHIRELFDERPYLQVGGNETIGQGWCAVALVNGGEGGR